MNTPATLPPMRYRLWLPHVGTYVRAIDWMNRRIVATINQGRALVLPEPEAVAEARRLISATRQTIELRPDDGSRAAGCES